MDIKAINIELVSRIRKLLKRENDVLDCRRQAFLNRFNDTLFINKSSSTPFSLFPTCFVNW